MNCRKSLLVLGVAFFGALSAKAQSTVWQPTVGQNWNNSSNWSFGLPASGVTTIFNNTTPSTFTSTVDTNFSIAALQVANGAGAMTLNDTGGSTVTITSGFSDASSNMVSVSVNLLGAGTMSVSGGAILNLSGDNTYSGATTISSGTLQAGSTTAFGPTSEVTISGSGVLDLNNNSNTIYSLSGTGFVTLGTGTLTVGGGLGPYINTVYSGVISG